MLTAPSLMYLQGERKKERKPPTKNEQICNKKELPDNKINHVELLRTAQKQKQGNENAVVMNS